MSAYGIERLRLNLETKASGEAHCPQQPQLVLAKTAVWFADCPDNPSRQISLPADIVEYFARLISHPQPVNREIAALPVFLRAACEHHGVRMPPIGVANVSAKGCSLHFPAVSIHSNDAELCPDRHAVGKQGHDLVGSSVRCDVVIRRSAP